MKKFLFIFLAFLAPIFFAHAANPIRILIEPGHDAKSWGAQFLGLKEADMNVKLGLTLYELLKQDKDFEVYLIRDWSGYKKEFSDYLKNNADTIKQFMNASISDFNQKISSGEVKEFKLVDHNKPSEERAFTLYGMNKWADENNFDAVIRIHFNDNPRADTKARGNYRGFAVYVPHESLKNSKPSSLLGSFIRDSLLKNYPVSNYKNESGGLIPEQKLASVGANDTLNTRSVLIEYGYIYEPRLSTYAKRQPEYKMMAKLTYEGIKSYFDYVLK